MSRLDEAKKRVEELQSQINKQNEQAKLYQDYVTKNGTPEIKPLQLPKHDLGITNAPTQATSVNELLKAREQENLSPLKKVANSVTGFTLGMGEGSGGGGILKGIQNAVYGVVGASEAKRQQEEAKKFPDLDLPTHTASENYATLKNDLGSGKETIDSLYNNLGLQNNQLARSIGNTVGYITGGTVLSALGVPDPVAYATLSGLNKYEETDDIGDIAVASGTGAVFGFVNKAVNKATVKGIEALFPSTNPLNVGSTVGKLITKNAIAGGTGAYVAGATTGELTNAYNALRGREVTKGDWTRPVWSTNALVTTLTGAVMGGITGTKSDIKYQQDVQTLARKMELYASKFNSSMQAGDQQSAMDIAVASRDELLRFSQLKYSNRNIDKKAINDVALKWKNFLEQTVAYYDSQGSAQPNAVEIQRLQAKYGTNNNLYQKYNVQPTIPSSTNIAQNNTKSSNLAPNNTPSSTNIVQKRDNITEIQSKNVNLSQNSVEKIQGLEDYTTQDIKDIVSDHIQDLMPGTKIGDIRLDGSNANVEVEGDATKLASALNSEPLTIDGVRINIKPIETSDVFEPQSEYRTYDFSKVKRGEARETERSSEYYDLSKKFDRRQRNIDMKNAGNNEILASQGIDEEVTNLLEKITSMRHDIHSSDALFNSESADNSTQTDFIDNINQELGELNLPKINLPRVDELISDIDVYELGEDYDETYANYLKQKEKINDSIEDWLQAFDEEFGTNYAPTGIARAERTPTSAELLRIEKQNNNVDTINKQINNDLKYNNIIDEDMSISDEKLDDYVNELVQKYYKPSVEAQNDEDIRYDEMLNFSNDVRNKVEKALQARGYTSNDDGYSASDMLLNKFEEITDYLDENNIDYETSKSIYNGAFPSIYIKDSEGNTVMRIGNHNNSQGAKQNYTNREILEDTQKIYDDIQKAVGNASISEPTNDENSSTLQHYSNTLSDDIGNVLSNIRERNPVKLRDFTPNIIVQNGVKDLPMYENPMHIRKNILTEAEARKLGLKINKNDHYHGLGKEKFIEAVDSLDNPRVMFRYKNDPNIFLILTIIKDNQGDNIVVPIQIETTTNRNNISIGINRIRSIFGYDRKKPNLNEYIKYNINQNIFEKIYEKKKQGTEKIPEQASNRSISNTSNNSITSKNNYVNNNDTTAQKIRTSMTMEEARDLVQRTFVSNKIKDWYDDKYNNGDEWLAGEGIDEVSMYAENTEGVAEKYLNRLYAKDESYNDEYDLSDILKAYQNGELVGEEKANRERVDTSKDTGYKGEKIYEPRDIKLSKDLYDKASQRMTNSNRNEVVKARADFIIAVHDNTDYESIGLTQEEVNKRLKAWANYPKKALSLSQSLNENVSKQNQWTGLENSSIVNEASVTDEELESLVKDIVGESNSWQRNYITGAMLALDTHIDYSNLTFDFGQIQELRKGHADGDYDRNTDVIRIGTGYQNTVAHEIGHFIDYQWCRELLEKNDSLSSAVKNRYDKSKLSENQIKFLEHFDEFQNSIERTSELGDTVKYSTRGGNYWQRPTEVFARFVGKFTEWVKNTATNGRYGYEELHYNDRFTESQYREFVKILQEKSALDTNGEINVANTNKNTDISTDTLKQDYIDTSEVDNPDILKSDSNYEETNEERAERVRKYIEETQKSIGTLGVEVSRKDIITSIVDNLGIGTKGNSKVLNEVAENMQEGIKNGTLTDTKIDKYADSLVDNLKVVIDDYYNANKELKELIRRTKLYVSDEIKNGFADWNDFRKSNIGTIRMTNDVGALPVDTFYQELTNTYGEDFFPSDITNASDELERIANVAKDIKKIDKTLRDNVEENFGEDAVQEIKDALSNNLKTLREKLSEEPKESFTSAEVKDRSWTKTATKNDMVKEFLNVEDMKYVTLPNKVTLGKANDILLRKGYDESLKFFESIVESGKFPTPDDIALGERLIQEAQKKGDFKKATELISDVAILGTELGQSVQALSMISRLSPEGQLLHIKKALERIGKQQKGQATKQKRKQKLQGMLTEITEGEQAKVDLPIDLKGLVDKIVTGEQTKADLPKEIRDNAKLMELVDKIVTGEQTKIKLDEELKRDSKLKEVVTEIEEGEQTKLDLGSLDDALKALDALKKTEFELSPEMEIAILSAQTPEELAIAVERAKQEIASKLPVEWSEKLSAWRYLMMLGNPKTHIRNILGNLVMKAPYSMKNAIQRILETAFDEKLEERTRTFEKSTQAVKDFARAMIDETDLGGSGYSNLESELKSMRKIFKTKSLQWLNQKNSNALEKEDLFFKKGVFRDTLAEYLTANGIKTEQNIKDNPELVKKGINYAVEEAKKATFNQYNKLATTISKLENDSTLGKIAVGGLAPFKRTPLNIVKTAWQYSPMGLAETITARTIDLKNGKINANEYIERLSQGLTGLGITALGFLLGSLGLISGSGSGDKKDKYEESVGLKVPYSIRIGNMNFDISWLSPSAVPLLIGAELYSLSQGEQETFKIGDIIEVIEKSMNPISDMTMVSTFNDALINYGSDDNSLSGVGAIVSTVVKSYIGQAFPTLGNQINKIIDPAIRTTSASKNSKWKEAEQVIRQNMNKIPGMSYMLEPSLDVWGNVRKRSDNIVLRSMDALLNPANATKDTSTEVDHEIMRLYDENGNMDIIPKTPNNYFTLDGTKYEFSASEYTTFKMTYGQNSYNQLEKLFKSSEYKSMSDAEKEKAIKDVYTASQDKAKEEYIINQFGKQKGYEMLMTDTQLKRYNQAKGLLTAEKFYKVYNAQSKATKKADKIQKISEMLPGLSNQEVTKIYNAMTGTIGG